MELEVDDEHTEDGEKVAEDGEHLQQQESDPSLLLLLLLLLL